MKTKYFSLMEYDQIAAVVGHAYQSGLLERAAAAPIPAKSLTSSDAEHRDPTSTTLNVLVELGYLNRQGESYVADDEYLKLRRDTSFSWKHLPEFMRSGKPWLEIDRSSETLANFYSSFFPSVDYADQMGLTAAEVASHMPDTDKNVLDIGAGTGLWSLAMAQRNHSLSITAVDLPKVLETQFLPLAASRGYGDRVSVIAGDFHSVDFGENCFDCIVMGSAFHFVRQEHAAAFAGKVHAALRVGGRFVVIDHFADATHRQRLSRLLYELRLAMRTALAKNYSAIEIRAICERAHLTHLRDIEVAGPSFLAAIEFQKN